MIDVCDCVGQLSRGSRARRAVWMSHVTTTRLVITRTPAVADAPGAAPERGRSLISTRRHHTPVTASMHRLLIGCQSIDRLVLPVAGHRLTRMHPTMNQWSSYINVRSKADSWPSPRHQRTSHQAVHILFLANDRCLPTRPRLRCRALLIIVLVRPNFYSALCLAIVQVAVLLHWRTIIWLIIIPLYSIFLLTSY